MLLYDNNVSFASDEGHVTTSDIEAKVGIYGTQDHAERSRLSRCGIYCRLDREAEERSFVQRSEGYAGDREIGVSQGSGRIV